ncbi:AAA family ATPase [Actinoplanes sp. CA-054009]
MSLFTPARREQMHLRMALQGPSGAGKTFTAMTIMRGLVGEGGKFAVVDTEKRAREYAVLNEVDPETETAFRFGHLAPSLADPEKLPGYLKEAAHAGFEGIIVDSFTHFWSGLGGALDRVDRARDKRAGWGEYRPVEAAMMDALLTFPGHVIVTMRVKTEYVTETNSQGRTITRKLGLKADQRDSVDYEFSVIGEIDMDHTLTVTKTTCQDLVDKQINKPGPGLVETLAAWLGQGDPPPTAADLRDRALEQCPTVDDLRAVWDEAKNRALLEEVVQDGTGELLPLGTILKARRAELLGAGQPVGANA